MTDEATAAGRPRPRRLFVLIVVLALALTVTAVVVVTDRRSQDEAALTTPPPAAPAADARRPNIILVTTDDMSLSDLQWMPNTRRLIGEVGARVDPFLSNHPLCCPARAQILTGQQAQNSGVFDNSGRYGGFPRLKQPNNHIGAWLKDAGYQTAFIGKFLNLWERRPVQQKGWSIFNPSSEGVYSAYDITMWNDGDPRRYEDVHTGDLMGQLTVETIEQFAADERTVLHLDLTASAARHARGRQVGIPGARRAASRRLPGRAAAGVGRAGVLRRGRERQAGVGAAGQAADAGEDDRPQPHSHPVAAVGRRPDQVHAARLSATPASWTTPTSSSPPTTASRWVSTV